MGVKTACAGRGLPLENGRVRLPSGVTEGCAGLLLCVVQGAGCRAVLMGGWIQLGSLSGLRDQTFGLCKLCFQLQ